MIVPLSWWQFRNSAAHTLRRTRGRTPPLTGSRFQRRCRSRSGSPAVGAWRPPPAPSCCTPTPFSAVPRSPQLENLLPVSTTPAVPVAKFAAGVVETGGKYITGVVDTCGAPWLENISANFRKNYKWPKCYFQGLGTRWLMKKNLKQNFSWQCSFNYGSQ